MEGTIENRLIKQTAKVVVVVAAVIIVAVVVAVQLEILESHCCKCFFVNDLCV